MVANIYATFELRKFIYVFFKGSDELKFSVLISR